MVSSETGGGLVDCSVGSIVWVRRRNGSWWPGKILGPEGLSSSLITSPRSGTPVKLLGREDASVDWYNLEKSKRVKTFRCGDFDECIERAEAAQGMPPKKREKYARREDAILHALELERQMLEKYGKLGYSYNEKSPDAVTSGKYLEVQGGGNPRSDVPSLSERLLGSSLVAAEKNATEEHHLHEETKTGIAIEGSSQVSGDDDDDDDDDDSHSVLPSRMRGLQDVGLCTAPRRQISGDELLSGIAFRSKRSRYAYLLQYDSGEDSSNDNRVQPSSSMLQTTPVSSKFGGSGYVSNVMGEDNISGSTEEDTETDFSETDSQESEDSDDEMIGLSDGSACIELRPKYPRIIEKQREHGSYNFSSSIDDVDGFTSADDDTSHPYPYDHHQTRIIGDGLSSKWKLKGKRNNRIIGKKRSMDTSDAAAAHISSSTRYIHGNSNWRSGSGFVVRADLVNHKSSSSRTHRISRQGGARGGGSKYEDYMGIEEGVLTWNNNINNQSAVIRRRGEYYWEDLQQEDEEEEDISGGRILMQLVEVDLNVEANNYCKNVPMTSLTSMLNGHSIIGHPIQVEALESGSTDKLVVKATAAGPGYFSHPELSGGGPVWRTVGRRTANSRVPRPRFDDKKQLLNPSSNQKIRTLSSIASSQQRKHIFLNDHHHSVANGGQLVDGLLIKTTVPTAIACIPVKLVFSRLHEELVVDGRHQ